MQQTTAQGGTEEIALVELQMGEHHGLFGAGGLDLSILTSFGSLGGQVASSEPLGMH